jgi:hypothetical protein
MRGALERVMKRFAWQLLIAALMISGIFLIISLVRLELVIRHMASR